MLLRLNSSVTGSSQLKQHGRAEIRCHISWRQQHLTGAANGSPGACAAAAASGAGAGAALIGDSSWKGGSTGAGGSTRGLAGSGGSGLAAGGSRGAMGSDATGTGGGTALTGGAAPPGTGMQPRIAAYSRDWMSCPFAVTSLQAQVASSVEWLRCTKRLRTEHQAPVYIPGNMMLLVIHGIIITESAVHASGL